MLSCARPQRLHHEGGSKDSRIGLRRSEGVAILGVWGEVCGHPHLSDAVRRLERRRERDLELKRAWQQATRFLNL